MAEHETLDCWAVVEIMGHDRYAGKIAEESHAGAAFLRIDVPELDGCPAFTKFFGAGAIFSITPCSQELAILKAREFHAHPVQVWTPQLQGRLPYDGDEEEDYE